MLGTIAHGAIYQVVRRYYRWYELRFERSPNGRAWVYGDLVAIEGDSSQIEVIDTLDAVFAGGGANALNAAGNADPADRNPRTVAIATVEADDARIVEVVDATPLPTYTPPPTRSPFASQRDVVEAADPRLLDLPPARADSGPGRLGRARSANQLDPRLNALTPPR